MPDYVSPMVNSMAQAAQVMMGMKHAALQQQQLQMERQKMQNDQATGLAGMLQSGAQPVQNGNVMAQAPQATAAVGPDGNVQYSLTGSSPVSLPADMGRTVNYGGQSLQLPTQQESFQNQLAQKGQLEQQQMDMEMKHLMGVRQATYVPLPHQLSQPLGLPDGIQVDPTKIPEYGTSASKMVSAEKDRETPDRMALETAAQAEAQKAGIQLDPTKSAIMQLPVQNRANAFQQAKVMNADPDLREGKLAAQQSSLASQASARATQGLTQELTRERIQELGQKNATAAQAAKTAAAQGPPLSPDGQKRMAEISTVGSQFNDLLQKLEPYKNDNNPLTLAGAALKYKLGMKTPEGELGNEISNLSLASIQGMMPFASKSRNYQFIKDIGQHLPKTSGPLPDSPALMYDKMTKASRNFMRMKNSVQRYDVKGASANPAPPTLADEDAATYLHLAGGDPGKARKMATQDGFQVQ